MINPKTNDDGFRKKILESHLITNIADPANTVLINLSTGETLDIRKSIIKKVLNHEYHLYSSSKIINAQFIYDPYNNGPLIGLSENLYAFNTYQPPQWKINYFYRGRTLEALNRIPKIYLAFFIHLTGNDVASFEYLLDWLTTSLKAKNFTILTLIGEQGIGKGILGEILEKLHGEENFVKVLDKVFKKQFNSQLANRTCVYVDEVDLTTKEAHDRIKDVVNKKIEIEAKGKDAVTIANYASFYLSSNHLDAVKVESGDRRFSILGLTDKKLNETSLINFIDEMLEPPNISELARYLLSRNVIRDMTVPFRSARFDEVKEAGLASWERFIVFDWAPKQPLGTCVDYQDLQVEILRVFPSLRNPPGRLKFEDLAKKYPKVIKVTKSGNDRKVIVLGSEGASNEEI